MSKAQDIPSFPEDVPTHPLLIIDYEKLKQGVKSEKDSFWTACTSIGFFYLRNHHVDIQPMWEMGAATMALPLEEKMKFEQGDTGRSFGYKAVGADRDEYGQLDTVEFINVAKDDALAWPKIVHRDYPSTVTDRMSSIKKFIEESNAVLRFLLDILSEYLELPAQILRERHDFEKLSGCQCRVTRNSPKSITGDKVSLGAHTDFGSLSFLHHNILGGLQVLSPISKEWQYIKPLEGHAICNIGDALSIYSAGILRSSVHRVVPAPGAQGDYVRWSLVYFLRPHATAIMEPLMDSALVSSKIQATGIPSGIPKGVTAGEWCARRVKYRRAANQITPDTWKASQGTENISG